jgi:SAM-dependent methyltransferase
MHGETVVWIGEQNTLPAALAQCMVRLPIFAVSNTDSASGGVAGVECIQATCQQLPFASGSVDGVVLHHALEAYTDPRACIREVERVLKPGGRLLICSFNPFSFTGLGAWVPRKTDNPLVGRRLISPIRLLDWLALLNLSVDEPPLYKSLSGPVLGDFVRRHRRPVTRVPGKLLALAWQYLSRGWRRVAPALVPLIRRLPIGGVVVLSAFKVGHGGTPIGRSRRTASRKTKLVLTPTVQSQHDG